MEWNHSRFQVPRGQATFRHQPLRPAQPRCWYYDNDDDETPQMWERNASPPSNGYNTGNGSPLIPSLKTDTTGLHGNNGIVQAYSTLQMPQLEDSTEIQSFYLLSNSTFPDNQSLSPRLLPPPSQLPQQIDQQYGLQLSQQFSDFPPEAVNYYPPPLPVSTARPSVDIFPEGIPALHNVHTSVPTLPPTLNALEHGQQLQYQVPGETRKEDENSSNVHTSTASIFNYPLPLATDTDPCLSLQPTLALPIGSFSARPSIIDDETLPPDYSPVIAPINRAKRGGGLSEPFTQMALNQEPKFLPDKRKLCCVEGCKSQARAFNRCKRHGGSKRCSNPGCTKSVQSRGLCIRHGGGSRCQEPGCTRASQSHGRCKMHGGGRPCVVAGCEKKAHLKRLCRRHGGGAKCCVTGCDKWAQRQGMCMTHSKVVTAQPSGLTDDPLLYKTSASLSALDSSPPASLQIFGDEV